MSTRRSNRLTNWVTDEEGRLIPVPTYERAYSDSELKAIRRNSGSNPYDMREGDPEKYRGMTCYEVACDRAAQQMGQGDLLALDQYENRALGKPKQQIEQTTVTLNFSEIAAERIAAGVLGYKTVKDEMIEQGLIIDVTPQPQTLIEKLGF